MRPLWHNPPVSTPDFRQIERQMSGSRALTDLPEREAIVLQLYFVEELNLEEIGQALGVGAARVCQIKKVALDKLRKRLGGWEKA